MINVLMREDRKRRNTEEKYKLEGAVKEAEIGMMSTSSGLPRTLKNWERGMEWIIP